MLKWCRHQESNPGPTDYKSVALPTELYRQEDLKQRWLGYQDSNLGVPIPKTGALPLGDTPAKAWWPETESNRRHEDFQSSALPTELSGQRGVLNKKDFFASTLFSKKVKKIQSLNGFLTFRRHVTCNRLKIFRICEEFIHFSH